MLLLYHVVHLSYILLQENMVTLHEIMMTLNKLLDHRILISPDLKKKIRNVTTL